MRTRLLLAGWTSPTGKIPANPRLFLPDLEAENSHSIIFNNK